MTQVSLEKKSQAGFTLVELAIVMIIIGLLIGGVLKGQELIGNAQIAATTAQVKAYDTATTTFHDIYDGLPGDLATPTVRIPNCVGECTTVVAATAGDNQIGVAAALGGAQALGSENTAYWAQLSAADLVTGVDVNGAAAISGVFPAGKVNGGFQVGFTPGGNFENNANTFRGHYLLLTSTPAAGSGSNSLTASQAARLDRKLDDGNAASGSVFTDTAGTCDAGAGVYNEAVQTSACDLYFRIQ